MDQTKEIKRVLIGWKDFDGTILLSGDNRVLVSEENKEENKVKVNNALDVLQAREAFTIQTNIITDIGADLTEYLNDFWQHNPNLLQEGWEVKIADLRGVCTIQPVVEIIHSKQRTNIQLKTNMLEIAKISIPKTTPTPLVGSFDPRKNTFSFSSSNPNLKILAPGTTPDGMFGFAVGIANSFVQVVKVNDRYFIRDGHHRAYGFLSNEIYLVPVLYREFNSINDMGLPQGLFPAETLIGIKPPRLIDYFDDSVSGIAEFTKTTKVVVVQGLEIETK